MARTRSPIVLAAMLACLICGCSSADSICPSEMPAADAAKTGMRLSGTLLAARGARSESPATLGCVQLSILDSDNYADTVRSAHLRLANGAFRIDGLRRGTVDLIFDRKGFYPVKVSNVRLTDSVNALEDRLLMYPSSTPVALPGQLSVEFKHSTSAEGAYAMLAQLSGLKVHAEPGSFRLELPYSGPRRTRKQTEEVARAIAGSQLVARVNPMASFDSVY